MKLKENIKTSKYEGVCWSESRNKWRAQYKIFGIFLHLGYFDTELEASNVYIDYKRKRL